MKNEMKALVKAKSEQGLWMEHRPVPEIGPDDVLIRVNKTGICGTDVHIWNWDDWAQRTVPVPLITGHEFAGEIVDMGRNVDGLSIGQRVSGEGHLIGRFAHKTCLEKIRRRQLFSIGNLRDDRLRPRIRKPNRGRPHRNQDRIPRLKHWIRSWRSKRTINGFLCCRQDERHGSCAQNKVAQAHRAHSSMGDKATIA